MKSKLLSINNIDFVRWYLWISVWRAFIVKVKVDDNNGAAALRLY